MIYNYNKNNVKKAQELRKNMTPEEKKLWYQFLIRLPLNVNRQKNIGNYIVDFFIAKKRIVIELDGIQHGMEKNQISDKQRDFELTSLGITVLRYKNTEINEDFIGVCKDILNHLQLTENDLKEIKQS